MEQYTDVTFIDRENITVAPDTHVIQASEKLGIISSEEALLSNVQLIVADRYMDGIKTQEDFADTARRSFEKEEDEIFLF